jgi:hypothetical protein
MDMFILILKCTKELPDDQREEYKVQVALPPACTLSPPPTTATTVTTTITSLF